MLDFSDSMNRKVAGSFLYELLIRPLDHEVDEDGNQIAIGDGVSLGGDREWAKAVSELAKKVHASVGEFEMVTAIVVEELARPCRERTADFMQWMHCLAVTGLLLENTSTLRSLEGKAIEPPELLQSLLLPAVSLIVMQSPRCIVILYMRILHIFLCSSWLLVFLRFLNSAVILNFLTLHLMSCRQSRIMLMCKGLL
jgi:hypothetical protein